ncbi:MAG: PQQ-binding-like beta-propeller repeat protein [Alphaproteobacteria bacterium]|nr:PQQ-binding-like beta-propeller repeat protein [Alphaproteobacteria bacterium]MBV9862113.1 PQQ-binding-like beta-propeller repeat protein [Alphaproteobacteria bacterium]
MSFAVTTRSYDNARTGANTAETELTPAAIRGRGLKLLFSLALPGDARGCEAQPLIVPSVSTDEGARRDVVYVATMANRVFAFDAGTGEQLWMVELGTPVNGTTAIDAYLINDHWGILSTPVIDPVKETLYACAWVSPDGSAEKAQHFLHAISLADGAAVHPPLNLEGATYDPGHGRPVQRFRSAQRKQRAALLLVDGAVMVGFGTIAETASTARGWLIAVETASFRIAAAWTATARGSGGGIWHSGGGPAADKDGNIYIVTGNGEFDAATDFGESIVKLRYRAPGAAGPGSFQEGSFEVVDWWTPWTDDGRSGGNPEGEGDEAPLPSNVRKVARLAARGVLPMDMGDAWRDQDFGSGGPVLAEAVTAVLAAGKDGILYTGNMQALGRTQPADLTPAATAANYAKLKAPPIFYTYYPGPQLSAAPSEIAGLNVLEEQRTHHLHGTPVLWRSAAHGWMHFCWGENGNLRAWALSDAGISTYLACSAEVASPDAPVPPGGMPGGMISLSANGDQDGVVWASVPYGDANMEKSPGRFLAYDAAQFGKFSDGSGWIQPLWDSQQWNWEFLHNKFNRPVVWNGRVYLPTYDARVLVLELG